MYAPVKIKENILNIFNMTTRGMNILNIFILKKGGNNNISNFLIMNILNLSVSSRRTQFKGISTAWVSKIPPTMFTYHRILEVIFFLQFAKWIMQEVDWQGILGGPIRVQVSISLRNILEIDELRQVAKNDEIANFLSKVFFQMSAIN